MDRLKVALMIFGDARNHEWSNLFRGTTEPRHKSIVEYHLLSRPITYL